MNWKCFRVTRLSHQQMRLISGDLFLTENGGQWLSTIKYLTVFSLHEMKLLYQKGKWRFGLSLSSSSMTVQAKHAF